MLSTLAQPAALKTILLLLASNVFMTIAWYGHLRFQGVALWKVVLVSWGIAFFEYCLQVPANRIGYESRVFSAFHLKILQEVLTLGVFAVFSVLWLKEKPSMNQLISFAFILGAVYFGFKPTGSGAPAPVAATHQEESPR